MSETIEAETKVVEEPKKPVISAALAVANTTASLPLTEAVNLLYSSALIRPGQTKATVLSVLSLGRELGLSDISSLTGIVVTPQGTIILSAQVMQLLIKKNGKYKLRVKQRSATAAEIEVWEWMPHINDYESCGVSISFTMKDAERAKLNTKENYVRYPSDMLFSRCLSAVFKTYCSDCLLGIGAYLPEEIDSSGVKSTEEGGIVTDAEYEIKPKSSPKKAENTASSPELPLIDRVKTLLYATKSEMKNFKSLYGVDDVSKLNSSQLENLENTLKIKQRATPSKE